MPYQTPVASERLYRLVLNSVGTVDGNPLLVYCSFSTENGNHADMAARFQELVDLIDASSTFTVSSATRTQQYHENVTPTA